LIIGAAKFQAGYNFKIILYLDSMINAVEGGFKSAQGFIQRGNWYECSAGKD
jgi:hypothetical protein